MIDIVLLVVCNCSRGHGRLGRLCVSIGGRGCFRRLCALLGGQCALICGGVVALLARSVACRCLRGFGRYGGLCALLGGGGCSGGQRTLVRRGNALLVTRTVSCRCLGDFCRFHRFCALLCRRGSSVCGSAFGSTFLSAVWCLCVCCRRGGLSAFCARHLAAFNNSYFPGGSARLVVRVLRSSLGCVSQQLLSWGLGQVGCPPLAGRCWPLRQIVASRRRL